ncbi:coiled-coil domain-containing protein 157-like [Salvelinus fontinalis]|uniref:coiled-coil domain-containing protein 157-like n=1 Tax=Salvelinus fontinalis TaxID=8038 RepID=UPI0024855E82|nr:coiled-coil domain-containing protein 157-like [Salvelinus fontinalis]
MSLEDSNSKLKAEISLQQERLHKLKCERDKLHQEVKALQVEEEARNKLEEKTQKLEVQLSSTQLLLDKENSKYQNACHQQESLQAKQMSLLERVDALDQECEELQGQLGETEDTQTGLQDRLTHISEEKDQLKTQLTQEQTTSLSSFGFSQSLPDTPRERQLNPTPYVQHSPLQTSSAGVLKH